MHERIPEYVATLKVKSISDYETPARICASYFDERGIDAPNDSDWENFKEYYRGIYRREKGKDISETTLQQNYVARGKAFYRWSKGQQTAPLFDDETRAPRVNAETVNRTEGEEAELTEEKRQSEMSRNETAEKLVRVNFLLKKSRYEILAVLSVFAEKSMTDILTEAVDLYVREHAAEAETITVMGNKLRSK